MNTTAPLTQNLFAGLDIGTSGCRLVVIDDNTNASVNNPTIVFESSREWEEPLRNGNSCTQDPAIWWNSIVELLGELSRHSNLTNRIEALLVDATSATVLNINSVGINSQDYNTLDRSYKQALMYSDSSCTEQATLIAEYAPDNNPALGAGSSLAKWIKFYQQNNEDIILHQCDWIIGQLSGHYNISDEHNCLKLGYDPVNRCWPTWMKSLWSHVDSLLGESKLSDSKKATQTHTKHSALPMLPKIQITGDIVSTIIPELAKQFNLSPTLKILSGTTDSTASFVASGATDIGDAVTSLGSSMVLKILADKPVFASQYGVYSHRLSNQWGDKWLVGGASNAGGAALKQYFTTQEMGELSELIKTSQRTEYNYYPLPNIGERFPIADPDKHSNTEPRPASDALFFQGLLEGISTIEKQGYDLLHTLGAPKINRVLTTGGGAQNNAWKIIRENVLKVSIETAPHQQAAYGAALLAARNY